MKIFLCKTYDGIEAYLKSNTFPNPPVSSSTRNNLPPPEIIRRIVSWFTLTFGMKPEFTVEFLLVVTELMATQEKTNYPEGSLTESLYEDFGVKDRFQVIQKAVLKRLR